MCLYVVGPVHGCEWLCVAFLFCQIAECSLCRVACSQARPAVKSAWSLIEWCCKVHWRSSVVVGNCRSERVWLRTLSSQSLTLLCYCCCCCYYWQWATVAVINPRIAHLFLQAELCLYPRASSSKTPANKISTAIPMFLRLSCRYGILPNWNIYFRYNVTSNDIVHNIVE